MVRRVSVRDIFWVAPAIAACLALSAVPLSAEPDEPTDLLSMCWTPDVLKGRAAERRPRWGVARARVAPPDFSKMTPVPVEKGLRGAIRRVELPSGRKLVALTLDLCEQTREVSGYDGGIVDYLRSQDVKATFFAGGKWLLTHPERAEQLMADGRFELGNHGWSHRNLRRAAGHHVRRELGQAQAAYGKVRASLAARQCVVETDADLAEVPARMRLMRFPYGQCNAGALSHAAQAGLLAVQWDVATGDPVRGRSARAIARTVLGRVRPGSIIIAHANGRGHNTARALPLVIPALRARGYEFVTVSELLAAGRPVIVSTCYDQRPGDTRWYDMARKAKRKAKHKARRKIWRASRN